MIIIPGWLVSIVTFPGVIVHEAAHLLFCRLEKLAVFEVCFFRVGNPAGYVIHEASDDFKAMFMVGMGPFFLNSALCVLFCSAAFMPVWELGIADPLAYFLYWLGLFNFARVVWADLLYGIAIGVWGPLAIFHYLA